MSTSGAGIKDRKTFARAMQSIAVGAKVARRGRAWTVIESIRYETSARLTLRNGRRSVAVSVMVGHTGPSLWEARLRAVAPAPMQSELPA